MSLIIMFFICILSLVVYSAYPVIVCYNKLIKMWHEIINFYIFVLIHWLAGSYYCCAVNHTYCSTRRCCNSYCWASLPSTSASGNRSKPSEWNNLQDKWYKPICQCCTGYQRYCRCWSVMCSNQQHWHTFGLGTCALLACKLFQKSLCICWLINCMSSW